MAESCRTVEYSKISKTKIYDKGLKPELEVNTAKPERETDSVILLPKMVESEDAAKHPFAETPRYSFVDTPQTSQEMQYAMPEEDLVCFRLSLAGLHGTTSSSYSNSSCHTNSCDEQRDELHSHRFSSVLEDARSQLVGALPQITEEMVSRAIIHAFASDRKGTRGRFCLHPFRDEYQEEVDQVWKAEKWIQENTQEELNEELVLLFLQECLNDIFLLIRNEDLVSADQALRIVLSVGAVLGLQSSCPLPKDTVVLKNLPKHSTRKALKQILTSCGAVQAVAIATENPKVAFCRFHDHDSARRAVANSNVTIVVGETVPQISMLHDIPRGFYKTVSRQASSIVPPEHISPQCVSKHMSETASRKLDEKERRRKRSSGRERLKSKGVTSSTCAEF